MHEIQMKVFVEQQLTDGLLLSLHRKISALLRLPLSLSTQVAEAGQMETTRLLEQPFAPVQALTQWQAILVFPMPEMDDFILGADEGGRILRRNTPYRFLEHALADFEIDMPYDEGELWARVAEPIHSVLARKDIRTVVRGSRSFRVICGGASKGNG